MNIYTRARAVVNMPVQTHGMRLYGTDTAAIDFGLTVAAAWFLATYKYNVSIWMLILLSLSMLAHWAFVDDNNIVNNPR